MKVENINILHNIMNYQFTKLQIQCVIKTHMNEVKISQGKQKN